VIAASHCQSNRSALTEFILLKRFQPVRIGYRAGEILNLAKDRTSGNHTGNGNNNNGTTATTTDKFTAFQMPVPRLLS